MARILVVDDEPLNRELIRAYFEDGGHELVEAASGQEGLDRAHAAEPDLVLLDVMMPGLSGFEVAPRLKALAGDQFLPVVLLTALNDQTSRMRGLEAGADDFLTKPIDRRELIIRTNNLLSLRSKSRALLQRNTDLLELQRFKDEMSGLVVHDLKSPIAVVLANCQYLAEELRNADAGMVEAVGDALGAAERVARLLGNMLDLVRMETQRFELKRVMTRPGEILRDVAVQRRLTTQAREIALQSEIDDHVEMQADPDLIVRVLENLFDNAMRHTPKRGSILIRCGKRDGAVQLDICNTGPGVPAGARELIFEKFGQGSASNDRANLGLGLYFCRLAVDSHGGRLWLDETPAFPTIFSMSLPAD